MALVLPLCKSAGAVGTSVALRNFTERAPHVGCATKVKKNNAYAPPSAPVASIVTPVVIFYIYYVRIFVLDHSEPAAMTSDNFRADTFEVKQNPWM